MLIFKLEQSFLCSIFVYHDIFSINQLLSSNIILVDEILPRQVIAVYVLHQAIN